MPPPCTAVPGMGTADLQRGRGQLASSAGVGLGGEEGRCYLLTGRDRPKREN